MSEKSADAGKERQPQRMLYEVCPVCLGRGGGELPVSRHGCKVLGVMETGATVGQLERMAELNTLRQEAGISAAMLRDGRARKMVDSMRSILNCCKRNDNGRPYDDLYEIEQIVKNALESELS